MSDPYDGECERKPATRIEVREYAGGEPGTRDGITRQAGVLSTGRTNERAAEQATFRGRELIRKFNR